MRFLLHLFEGLVSLVGKDWAEQRMFRRFMLLLALNTQALYTNSIPSQTQKVYQTALWRIECKFWGFSERNIPAKKNKSRAEKDVQDLRCHIISFNFITWKLAISYYKCANIPESRPDPADSHIYVYHITSLSGLSQNRISEEPRLQFIYSLFG